MNVGRHKFLLQLLGLTWSLIYFILGIAASDARLSAEKRLHKRLFNESYYSVDLLPRHNLSTTINVQFALELIKIVEVVSVSFICVNRVLIKDNKRTINFGEPLTSLCLFSILFSTNLLWC